jgi:pimeloyl-ACP methyl ester carboxylesterase
VLISNYRLKTIEKEVWTVENEIKAEFIQLDGLNIHIRSLGCDNEGPTIVFESGYGDDSSAWDSVIYDVAQTSKIFLYDRAGVGLSDKSSKPRTSLQMVKELNEILLKSKVTKPVILVGHSFGGLNARLYATLFPKEIAGIVLVDSTPEDYKDRLLPKMSMEFQSKYNKQFVLEGNYHEFMMSLNQVKQNRNYLGKVPITVISAGEKVHYSAGIQELWHEMQKEILNLSSVSEFIIAPNSGHYVQNDEPQYVIEAIEKIKLLHSKIKL